MAPKAKAKGKKAGSFKGKKPVASKLIAPPSKDDLGAARLTDIPHFHAGACCLVEQPNGAWAEVELAGEENGALLVRYVRSGCLEPLAGRRLCEQPPLILPGMPTVGDAVLVGAGAQRAGEWWQGVVLDTSGETWRVAYGRAQDGFIWTLGSGGGDQAQVKFFSSEQGEIKTSTATLSVRRSKIKKVQRSELRQGLHWLAVEGVDCASLKVSASVFSGPFIGNTSFAGYACSPGAAWFASSLPFCQKEPKKSLTSDEFQNWVAVAGLQNKEAFQTREEPVMCLTIGEAGMIGTLETEDQQVALYKLMAICTCGPPPPPDDGGIDAYIFDYAPMVADILSNPATRAALSSGDTGELVEQLAEIMSNSIRRSPQFFAAASRAIAGAVASAPEIMEGVNKLWQGASDAVMTALESDEAAKAFMVATQVASQAAAFCKLAVERGAPIARQSINAAIDFLSDPEKLKDASADAMAMVSKVLEHVQPFIPQAELERFGLLLSKSAETLGEEFGKLAELCSSSMGLRGDGGGGGSIPELEEAKKFLNTTLTVAERDGGRITKSACDEMSQAVEAGGKLSAEMVDKSKVLMQEVVRSVPPQLVGAFHKATAAAANVDAAEIFAEVKGLVLQSLSVASNAAVYLGSMNIRLNVSLDEMQRVASGTVLNLLQQAKQKGADIPQSMLDMAQKAYEDGKPIAEAAMKDAQKGISSALEKLDDVEVADMQRAFSAAGKACGGAYSQLASVTDKAVVEAIAAGRVLAPLAGKIVEPGVGHCATLAAGALVAAREAADNTIPEEWRGMAATAASEMKAATDEAVAVVGPAAQSVTAYVAKVDYMGAANNVAGVVAVGAAAAGEVVLPVLGEGASALAGLWDAAELDEAYTMSADAVKKALHALSSGALCAALNDFDLLNFEIIRDFYQLTSLFFSNVATESYKGIAYIWGYVGCLFALDINFMIPKFPIIVALIGTGVAAIICCLVSLCLIYKAFSLMPDAIADGLEAKGWNDLQETHPHTLRAIKYNLVLLLCIHLPVSRMAMQIMACRDDDEDIQSLKTLLKYKECPTAWTSAGVFFLLFVGLGVPAVVARIIHLNMPKPLAKNEGKTYDKDGITLIEFTDEIYNDRVTNDLEQKASPFVDLYRGFERRWAYFKCVMMLLKLLLAAVVVGFSGQVKAQTMASFGILALYTCITAFSTPYIEHNYDKTELSGKIANMTNLILGVINHRAARYGVMVVMILQSLVLIYYTLKTCECSNTCIKNLMGSLEFTDTRLDKKGKAEKIIPFWNLDLEVQHRIWWPFWDGILLNCFSEDTARRFLDLKRIVENEGRAAIEEHFAAMSDEAAMTARQRAIDELEGVDCFWDGTAFDGSTDCPSFLGKMYIKRYPFECVVVWDDGEDHCFLAGREKVQELVAANQRPEVQAIRQNRWELRALVGCVCHLDFDRIETRTVEDGTETYTDSEGNSQTRTRHATISVHMFYHAGTAGIKANTSKRMAAGFHFTLSYHDGHGTGHAPHTGEKHFDNQSATISATELGFPPTFERVGRLSEFLDDPRNQGQAQGRLHTVHEDRAAYRREMQTLYDEEETLLPSAFWFKVYIRENSTRQDIDQFFSECPGEFPKLPATHAKGLDYVFARIQFALKSKRHAFWYCFFDDLWSTNSKMSCFKEDKVSKEMDPTSPDSICYSIMQRKQLDDKLTDLGLRRPGKLFSDALMTLFFDLLQDVDAVGMSRSNSVKATTLGYERMTE